MHQYPNQQLLASSPSSTQSRPQKRKRREASVSANSTPRSKGVKGLSPRKDKKRKQAAKPQIQQLPAPLSELTKDNEHVEIKDMSQWVNRSLETRRAENSKRVGYVTRPMNSFMLYRSAYSERCKHWCKANNHQVVSTVAGQSWPMESKAIRDEFAEYARIERENHALANPDYRFRPHKAKKAKKSQVESDEELSEFEYSEEEEETPRIKRCTNTSRHLLHEEGYADEGENGRERSTFQHNNPGMPTPRPLGAHNLKGHYMQTTVKPNMRDPSYVEDLTLETKGIPGQGGMLEHAPLTAMPGGNHRMLLSQQSRHNVVDPVLYEYSGGLTSPTGNGYPGFFTEIDQDVKPNYYQGMTREGEDIFQPLYPPLDPYSHEELWRAADEHWYHTGNMPKSAT